MSRIWLFGAMTFVAALVVGGVVVALVTSREVELLSADSPEGVVQRYLLALEDEEYEEAYGYLSSALQRDCTYVDFVRGASSRGVRDGRVTLEDTQTFDDSALVRARVTEFQPDLPFGSSEYSYDRTFELELEEGQWRLAEYEWWCPRHFEPR